MAKKTSTLNISYAEAMAEIENILAAMNAPSSDIDSLATNVSRANELLEICKAKLLKAQSEVEKILADKK